MMHLLISEIKSEKWGEKNENQKMVFNSQCSLVRRCFNNFINIKNYQLGGSYEARFYRIQEFLFF